MKHSKKRSPQQEKSYNLWSQRWDQARSLGLEKGRKPKRFSPALKNRLYRAYKKLGRAFEKGGKDAYLNAGENYYKYTSLKVNGSEAIQLRKKGELVYKNRLIVNSPISYKPSLHRKFKDPLTRKKGLAIVYRETGRGPFTIGPGSNYRVKLVGSSFTLQAFMDAVEAGNLPDDNRINYSISIGTNLPFHRTFQSPEELLTYIGVMSGPQEFPRFKTKNENLNILEEGLISISVYGDTRMRELKSIPKPRGFQP